MTATGKERQPSRGRDSTRVLGLYRGREKHHIRDVDPLKLRQCLNLRLPWLASDVYFLFIIILFDRKNLESESFGILCEFLNHYSNSESTLLNKFRKN